MYDPSVILSGLEIGLSLSCVSFEEVYVTDAASENHLFIRFDSVYSCAACHITVICTVIERADHGKFPKSHEVRKL